MTLMRVDGSWTVGIGNVGFGYPPIAMPDHSNPHIQPAARIHTKRDISIYSTCECRLKREENVLKWRLSPGSLVVEQVVPRWCRGATSRSSSTFPGSTGLRLAPSEAESQ